MPVDVTDCLEALDILAERLQDGTQPLAAFDIEIKGDMGREWARFGKARGGVVRGQVWKGFADQYTRKTDGVVVPAEGGVQKVNIKRTHIGFNLAADPESGWLGRGTPITRAEAAGYQRGTVQGKKRPSGQRVESSSILNQDTGRLRNEILARAPWIRVVFGATFLRIGNQLPEYAYHVLVELARNILVWVDGDEGKLRKHLDDWHEELAVEFNTRPSTNRITEGTA